MAMARKPCTSGRKLRSPGGVPASSPASGDRSTATDITFVAVLRRKRQTPALLLPDPRPLPDHSPQTKCLSRGTDDGSCRKSERAWKLMSCAVERHQTPARPPELARRTKRRRHRGRPDIIITTVGNEVRR